MVPMLTFLLFTLFMTFTAVNADDDFEKYQDYTTNSLLWAPYRPQCYFGIRPRNINDTPFSMGLMWFDATTVSGYQNFRHEVEMNDNLQKFSWEVYDPRIGGKENILDEANNLNLTISFAKSHDGQNWISRIRGQPLDPERETALSMVLYMNQNSGEKSNSFLQLSNRLGNNLEFSGLSEELGKYKIEVTDNFGSYFKNDSLSTMEIEEGADCSKTSHVSFNVPDAEIWQAKDIFQNFISQSLQDIIQKRGDQIDPAYSPSILTIRNLHNFPPNNFHYIQKTFDLKKNNGFEFDIIYNNHQHTKENIKSKQDGSRLISNALDEINIRFDNHFEITGKDREAKRSFGLEILSNLLGGIGYFHGDQMIDRTTEFNEEQFERISLVNSRSEGPYDLFTSVPSRAFFPRGFYWDEGFHLLQILEYDFDLAFEIINSWFDIIDDDGWIAREVILGPEARRRVPEEFRTQSPQIANPPTLLLAFNEMLNKVLNIDLQKNLEEANIDDSETEQLMNSPELLMNYGSKIYPKLLKHFEWFIESQRGLIGEYEDILEDDPLWDKIKKNAVFKWVGRTASHCLPSGLDDYPRAQPPDIAELNVDALAWVGIMTRSMKEIAHILNYEQDELKFAKLEEDIIHNLETLHWSDEHGCYCDVTINPDDEMELVCHEGYISILPFALKLIPEKSKHIATILNLIGDENKLFSPFGILSLSKQDEYFAKGEDYWRGNIWMNINYLCLDALKFYYPSVTLDKQQTLGAATKEAHRIFTQLKKNLIDNVYQNWKVTNFVFENYDAFDGHGKGAKQFTGWTSLIVNILGF